MDAQRGIARRMVIGLPTDGLTPAWEKDFAAYPPAGVIVFARDFGDLESLRQLTSRLRALARPRRIFIATDEEGGFVSQLRGHLAVPPNATLLARGGEPGDIEWACRVSGERLRALGIDWVFAPVADIHSEQLNPVIGPRAFGTSPEAVAAAVGEALRGYRAARVASCLKHFPGHGDTVLDSHIALPRCDAPAATLETRELRPFRAHLDADSLMTAHVVYPALDPERPATFSRAIVHDLLRERMGYAGIAVTDALEMKGAAEGRSAAESGRLALEAGCDLLLYAFHDESLRRARLELARMLADGLLERSGFDAARPRLAAFDGATPEPTADELARPLDSLTPRGFEERLGRIVERGLIVRGPLPPAAATGPWRVSEPAFPHGRPLAEELAAAGVPVARGGEGGEPALELVAVMSRLPMAAAEMERLRALARTRPLALVGLQADAFLEPLAEAALRISAADASPLTRRVVAGTLARLRAAAAARA
jgi:beta-glucosidase-like glycosyl hydrolase